MNVPDSPDPWALALTNNISPKYWSALKNPGTIASEERKNAARIIQALVVEGTKAASTRRSAKPGPKPRAKSNQTDDDIVCLWSCIRMILELPNRTSIPSIFSKAASVLKHSRVFCEKHLLLTAAESNIVSLHLAFLSHLPNNSDILEECACPPKSISELNPPASLKHWASLNSDQKNPHSVQPWHSKRTQRLDAVFVELVRLLELHKAPLLHDQRVTIHEDARNEEWRHLEFHEFESLTELRFKKKDILWTVIGKLAHLKTILRHANFAWSPIDPEHLINEIEMANSSFGRPTAKSENNQNRASLNALRRIITSASDHQGTSPFSSFLPSFIYKSFPTPASPGQIVTE